VTPKSRLEQELENMWLDIITDKEPEQEKRTRVLRYMALTRHFSKSNNKYNKYHEQAVNYYLEHFEKSAPKYLKRERE